MADTNTPDTRPSEPGSPPDWSRGRARLVGAATASPAAATAATAAPVAAAEIRRRLRAPGGGGRERLTRAAITEAIRPCTPPGAFGARHWPTRSTSARHRIRHGIRHTSVLAGRRLRPYVANDRLRHILIGYARVSKADGSQSLDLQHDALRAAGVDAGHVYHDHGLLAR